MKFPLMREMQLNVRSAVAESDERLILRWLLTFAGVDRISYTVTPLSDLNILDL